MRCNPHAALGAGIAVALGLVAALVTTDCTPMLCSRNSDCPTGQVCSSGGGCAIAPDGGSDSDAADDAGSAATDATTDTGSPPVDAQSSGGGGGGSSYREAAPWPF
ncbi:MAG TPA: hypothetical protein VHW23_40180 [Kofleriaceae bacterium]|jgi:Cys-rich repeat protein|nr:hypothetical protein [Kofleriaceae bacterium]